MERCTNGEIPLYELSGEIKVRCVLYDDESGDSLEIEKHLSASI